MLRVLEAPLSVRVFVQPVADKGLVGRVDRGRWPGNRLVVETKGVVADLIGPTLIAAGLDQVLVHVDLQAVGVREVREEEVVDKAQGAQAHPVEQPGVVGAADGLPQASRGFLERQVSEPGIGRSRQGSTAFWCVPHDGRHLQLGVYAGFLEGVEEQEWMASPGAMTFWFQLRVAAASVGLMALTRGLMGLFWEPLGSQKFSQAGTLGFGRKLDFEVKII